MKVFGRVLVALIASIAALFASTGTSQAGMDNELSVVDGSGRTLTIQQWDTFLNGVYPLDRNRLTREWFHSGRAVFAVVGDGADEFEGQLELGYQIGFPWSLGVGISFSYSTPNIALDGGDFGQFGSGSEGGDNIDLLPSVSSTPFFPGATFTADLGNGPGITEVATFSVEVSGAAGAVAVNNAHGTVTGAAGGVLLRPFARLISGDGDSVTTYGEPWNMN
ncbi:MAG: MspA family porin [Mycobacterium sp.]